MSERRMSTYEASQPWVVYHYGLTHDRWWPPWNSTRVLGYCKIVCECAVCGAVETLRLRIPRFAKIAPPKDGRHPARFAFLERHAHPDRGHPWSWERPLLNLAALEGGIDLDSLGRRLRNDLRGEARP